MCSIDDLTDAHVAQLLDAADVYAATPAIDPVLTGQTVASCFFEPSTRTSSSFELAASRLGAHVVRLEAKASSLTKGESLRDTVQTIDAYDPSVIVLRHPRAGAASIASHYVRASLVNAGDGAHQHPTQALLDLLALRRRVGATDGLNVWVVGDVLHSRVARSTITLLQRMGCSVTVCGPPTLVPAALGALGCEVTHDLSGIGAADVVYALRMQFERMQGDQVPSIGEYTRTWRIDADRLGRDQLLMHPGPVNRDVEVAGALVDDDRSLILDQVRAGLHMRMAILADTAGNSADSFVTADTERLEVART